VDWPAGYHVDDYLVIQRVVEGDVEQLKVLAGRGDDDRLSVEWHIWRAFEVVRYVGFVRFREFEHEKEVQVGDVNEILLIKMWDVLEYSLPRPSALLIVERGPRRQSHLS
jgi:hypothetical protein